MSIVLGSHRYGKAENRIVPIYCDTPRHEIHDISVSTTSASPRLCAAISPRRIWPTTRTASSRRPCSMTTGPTPDRPGTPPRVWSDMYRREGYGLQMHRFDRGALA